MSNQNLASLVGHCGLYCNACGIRQGKIKDAVECLRGILSSYGFDKIMPELSNWEPSFEHYGEFDKVMSGLVKMFGSCPGCLNGGGDPDCKVRSCARQAGYATCAECSENQNCEKLAPFQEGYKGLSAALEKIKQTSTDKYAEEMQRKVANGYSYLEERS